MQDSQTLQIIDFEHYKNTGKIKSSHSEDRQELSTIEERLEQLLLVLELSTDEILLELSKREESPAKKSLYYSLPIELLIEELTYRASIIDHILLKTIEKHHTTRQ